MPRMRFVCLAAALSVLVLSRASALAGGAKSLEDELAHAAFFGFVRDQSGRGIADVKVTADFTKRHIKLIGRTDVTGQYLIPKLGDTTDPKTVNITCEKDGYNFERAIQRDLAPKPDRPVEVDCFLSKK